MILRIEQRKQKRKTEEECLNREPQAANRGTNAQYISDAKKVEATAPEVAESRNGKGNGQGRT